MIIAVMAIMMAVAVQLVSFQMKREREAELIFRGEQYVEAIRLYKMKYGRNPMRLKELWEADPRVLRQKWTDPITGSDKWGLVFMGQESFVSPHGNKPRHQAPPTPTRTPVFGDRESALGDSPGEKVGPIIGVHSRSTDESIKIYKGRTRYSEWLFVLEEQQQQGPVPGTPEIPRTPGNNQTPLPTPPHRRTGTPGYR
jgi:type II secretory pathway pseudopilin PulG